MSALPATDPDAVTLEAAKQAVKDAEAVYTKTWTLDDLAVLNAAEHSLVVVEHAIYIKGLEA